MSDARAEAERRYHAEDVDGIDSAEFAQDAFVAGAEWQRTRAVTDDMLERALDTYADRIINTSDGLTAPERRAEAMRAAIIAAVGGTRE